MLTQFLPHEFALNKDAVGSNQRSIRVGSLLNGALQPPVTMKPFFIMDWLENVDEKSLESARKMIRSKRDKRKQDRSKKTRTFPLGRANASVSNAASPRRSSSFQNESLMDNVWNYRGMEKARRGLWDDALYCWSQTLKEPLKDEFLGEIYNNMGIALGKLGRYEDALDLLDRAYEIRLELHGLYDMSVAATLHNTGNVVQKIGEFDRAMKCFRRARSIKERVLGNGDDALVAHEVRAIGHVHYLIGDYDDAWEAYTEALKILRKSRLNDADPDVTNTLMDIADVERLLAKNPSCAGLI